MDNESVGALSHHPTLTPQQIPAPGATLVSYGHMSGGDPTPTPNVHHNEFCRMDECYRRTGGGKPRV